MQSLGVGLVYGLDEGEVVIEVEATPWRARQDELQLPVTVEVTSHRIGVQPGRLTVRGGDGDPRGHGHPGRRGEVDIDPARPVFIRVSVERRDHRVIEAVVVEIREKDACPQFIPVALDSPGCGG